MESATDASRQIIERTTLERYVTGSYVIWLRDLTRFWRDTPRRLGLFVQPLVYLFLLGTGLQSALKVFGAGDTKYVIFMFPGIVGMTVLFTSVFSAISILWDRQFGFLKEVLVSPVPRSSVAVGKILGGASTAFLQALILMALMFAPMFFGFSLSTLWKVAQLIPLTLLLALGMTSLGVAIAARLRSFESFPILMNFILMPLFFLSGAMFPLQQLPWWMKVLTRMNPLSYGIDIIRGVALKGVQITSAPVNPFSKVSPQLLQNIPPDVLKEFKQIFQSIMPKMTVQKYPTYPVWLDLLVLVGFGLIFMAIGIWQFTRTD